jgi:hypothetical protein
MTALPDDDLEALREAAYAEERAREAARRNAAVAGLTPPFYFESWRGHVSHTVLAVTRLAPHTVTLKSACGKSFGATITHAEREAEKGLDSRFRGLCKFCQKRKKA